MTSLTSSQAAPADLDAVHAVLAAAGEELARHGFANWVPDYPRERLEADIRSGVVWAVRDDLGTGKGTAVATYMLRAAPVHAYQGIQWKGDNANARYLNRLAVDPSRQGTGIGRWCLAHIAASCAREGISAVRCDVITANSRLCAFYERGGYERRGTRTHSGWTFGVYEKVLSGGE